MGRRGGVGGRAVQRKEWADEGAGGTLATEPESCQDAHWT